MIILASNGLSSPSLQQEVQKYIHGGKAALVVTADNEYKAENYHVARVTKELEALGLTVAVFDFDIQTPVELMEYDVVEMIGGNPYYLLQSIKDHGFQDTLKLFAEERTLIGWSAGALVIGPTLSLIDQYTPEMNFMGLADLTALNLTHVQILPHYSKFIPRISAFEEKCANYEKEHDCNVIRISDGDGAIIDNCCISVIRANEI